MSSAEGGVDLDEHESAKEKVQAQFGRNADKYVSSPLHAGGEDLAFLTAAVAQRPGGDVLDIATGGGHTANALAPLVRHVTAFDITEAILEAARRFIRGNGRMNVDFVRGDAEAMPFADDAFDAAACRIAAHHFPNVPAFAAEAYRVVKPGGTLFLIDNVAPERDAMDAFYNETEKLRDPSHVRALKTSEWIGLLENAGFRLDTVKRFRKTFVFPDWCARAGLSAEAADRLERKMLQAPDEIRRFFAFETDRRGALLRFTGESACFQLEKPFP